MTPMAPSVEDAVRTDNRLTDDQKAALLAVYRSYVAQNAAVKRRTQTTAAETPARAAPERRS